jgi:hypothetical protein
MQDNLLAACSAFIRLQGTAISSEYHGRVRFRRVDDRYLVCSWCHAFGKVRTLVLDREAHGEWLSAFELKGYSAVA